MYVRIVIELCFMNLSRLAALQPNFELKTSRVWQRYGLNLFLLVRSVVCFVSTSVDMLLLEVCECVLMQ